MKDKEALRKEYLKIRKEIQNKQEKSNIIFQKIIEDPMYNDAKVIAIYINLANEVNTYNLINYSIQNGKIVVVPRVNGDNLDFYHINSISTDFQKSKFGILEPIANPQNIIAKELIDLAIVPGICFDEYGNRVGFGKGYYDRFLENTNIKTIGICFKEQITLEVINADANDIKMNRIITN